MLSATRSVISHNKIIEIMAKLGYEEINEGICNGLAQMWIQAVFCEETEKFINRLYFICQEPDLLNKITAAKAKKGINLKEEDYACLEVLAFFDGVQLYQNFRLYTHLFNFKPHHLDAAAISTLTLPIKLEKRPIVEIYSENRLFNIFCMQRYLNELANEFALYAENSAVLKKFGQQLPELVIALHSCTHKVTLRYNNKITCWELADANQYTPFYLPCPAAPAVLQSLTEGPLTPVNVSIFTTDDNMLKTLMQTVLAKFKKPDFFSTLSVCALSTKKTHLLALTAMRGDDKNFIKIAKEIPNTLLWEYMLTAAKAAIYHGQTCIVNIIINQFPDCLMRAEESQEFLAVVIANRQNDLIKKIIARGAEIDGSYKGQRPLHIAISTDNLEAIKELIALDATIDLTNDQGETPLFCAIKLHRIAIIDFLAGMKKINLESPNKQGHTPLIAAVQQNSSAACEVLLRHGANPDNENKEGETPTLTACTLGHKECLKVLMTHGASLNLFDHIGRTPLFVAVIKQNWEMAATILLNLKTLDSFNPFSYQLVMNHLRDIIRYAAEQLEKLSNEDKKQFRSDVNHHRNALGVMLVKKTRDDSFAFFKPKEKQRVAYKRAIYSACKPTPTFNVDSSSGYIRL